MSPAAAPAKPTGLALIVAWPRVRVTLAISVALGLLFGIGWKSGPLSVLERTVLLGFIAMLVFGLFEQWPKRLPRGLARWVLQVVGVAVAIRISTWWIYVLSTDPGAPHFWEDPDRMEGFGVLCFFGMLIAPWVALAALVRQSQAVDTRWTHHECEETAARALSLLIEGPHGRGGEVV